MKTYIFKINLLDNPKIMREIEIMEHSSPYKLAEAIVGAYNFNRVLNKIGKAPGQY